MPRVPVKRIQGGWQVSSRRRSWRALVLAVVGVVSLSAAGCGDDEETTTTTTEPAGVTGATGATGPEGAEAAGELSEIQLNLKAAGYTVQPGKGTELTPEFASIEADEGLTVSGKDVTFAFVLSYPSEEDAQTVAGEAADAGQSSAVEGSVLFVGPDDQDAINNLALDSQG